MRNRRMDNWVAASLVMIGVLAAVQPDLVLRLLAKTVNVTTFAVIGWAFARAAYAALSNDGSGRIEQMPPELAGSSILGRSIIIGCFVAGGAIGL